MSSRKRTIISKRKVSHSKDMFLGVDPGWGGCFAIIDRTGHIVETMNMIKQPNLLVPRIHSIKKDIRYALVESVHSMPRQGVSTTFKFGRAFGIMEAFVMMACIPYELITPVKWQTEMKCRSKGDKAVTREAARRLFPNYHITDKSADAILLAELARRKALELGW